MDTITMINDETEGFDFTFDDASCHSTAFTARLVIEPKLGTIPPKSRFVISFLKQFLVYKIRNLLSSLNEILAISYELISNASRV